ncbi:expressed protein [Phakopsora pachyrhizi]|uniref:Expressed protein n=1 Tax=Phakopsora pachyrhizi TaxID=170000 RepID=A0AAV0BL05_PHAPC|nr:expressed protein [Phakopsora pachyrhizi]
MRLRISPEGATGLGNPVGGLIFTESFGEGIRQVKDWTSFMGDGEFCMRICNPDDEESTDYCNQRYDMMGCKWVMPGVYTEGFDSCEADSLPPPGVYGSSTFKQGDTPVPPPHEPTLPTNCSYYSELKPIPANNLTSFQCVAPTKKNPKRNSSSVADYARSKSRAYRLRCNFFLQPALIILLMSLMC